MWCSVVLRLVGGLTRMRPRSRAAVQNPSDEPVQDAGQKERDDVEDDEVCHVVYDVAAALQFEGTRLDGGSV